MARPDGWAPPTMATVEGVDPASTVKCVCGRTVRADMMYDLDPVPAAERPRKLSAAGRTSRYACDSCREDDFRTGRLPKGRYLDAIQAPADLRAKVARDPAFPGRRMGQAGIATGPTTP